MAGKRTDGARTAAGRAKGNDAERTQAARVAPPKGDAPLRGEALIARKKLAGAGRSEEPGKAFGSRWTDAERAELQRLLDEHGREQGIRAFVEAHPHRTPAATSRQERRPVALSSVVSGAWVTMRSTGSRRSYERSRTDPDGELLSQDQILHTGGRVARDIYLRVA